MEGNGIAVVRINSGSGDDGSAQITSNVFNDSGRVAFVWHSSDIEAIFMIRINGGFDFFKGVPNAQMEFIEKISLKGITKELIIEMFYMLPQERIANPTLRNKTVDMRVPFKIPTKGMQYANETGSEKFRFAKFMK